MFHADLSQELSLMLSGADDHNVIIQAGENQNMKEFRAHSNILRARSPYFKSALLSNGLKRIIWSSLKEFNQKRKNVSFITDRQ